MESPYSNHRLLKLHIYVLADSFHCHEYIPVGNSVSALIAHFRQQFDGRLGNSEAYSLFVQKHPDNLGRKLEDVEAGGGRACKLLVQDNEPILLDDPNENSTRVLQALTKLSSLQDNDSIIVSACADLVKPFVHSLLLGISMNLKSENTSHSPVGRQVEAKTANIFDVAATSVANCYSGWRSVFHDGNDYYRAAIFRVLEIILVSSAGEVAPPLAGNAHDVGVEVNLIDFATTKLDRVACFVQLLRLFQKPFTMIELTTEESKCRDKLIKLLELAAGKFAL
jgi:hypothetical protein